MGVRGSGFEESGVGGDLNQQHSQVKSAFMIYRYCTIKQHGGGAIFEPETLSSYLKKEMKHKN